MIIGGNTRPIGRLISSLIGKIIGNYSTGTVVAAGNVVNSADNVINGADNVTNGVL